jgi:cell wall-associated NlpC family hydrolase
MQPGDAFTIRPGCDKSFATCRAKFANSINFRGFPYVPGTDQVLRYPMPTPDPEAILAAARSWLGTPWRHQGRLKGIGVDCGGLIIGVGRELGLLDFDTQAYGRIPDGRKLRKICVEHLLAKPVTDVEPSDVLLMRVTRHPQHLAIVGGRSEPFSLIHA